MQRAIVSPEVVETLAPHLEWYLSYLMDVDSASYEPPWITIYAFKASLVAWQLVREGIFDHVVGIGVVDLKGMCQWIRETFEARSCWKVGQLIVNSLSELEACS